MVIGAEIAAEQGRLVDMESRIVQATLGNLVLASVYVPNGGKDYAAKIRFLGDLVQWAEQLHADGRDVVVCGDLNVAHADIDVHPRERKAGVIGQRPEERDLFDRLLGTHFVDVARTLSPDNDAMFTWWPPWRNMLAVLLAMQKFVGETRLGRRAPAVVMAAH